LLVWRLSSSAIIGTNINEHLLTERVDACDRSMDECV